MVDLFCVVIVVVIFKCFESLVELLDGIVVLDVQVDVLVVICDNDVEGVVGQVVVKCYVVIGIYFFLFEVIVVEQCGILYVCNGLFVYVSENYDCDYIVIIDDDEMFCKIWLVDLFVVVKDINVDVIGGLVLLVFVDLDVSIEIKECE